MGKAVESRGNVKNEEKLCGQFNPPKNISGIAFDMKLQIEDAIGVARTAQERQADGECVDCEAALRMILFRLWQIHEGHALIIENAPYALSFSGEKERLP